MTLAQKSRRIVGIVERRTEIWLPDLHCWREIPFVLRIVESPVAKRFSLLLLWPKLDWLVTV